MPTTSVGPYACGTTSGRRSSRARPVFSAVAGACSAALDRGEEVDPDEVAFAQGDLYEVAVVGLSSAADQAGRRINVIASWFSAGTDMKRPLSSIAPIRTARLRLRPLEVEDAEAFRAMTDHPAILDAVHILSRPFTVAKAEELLVGGSSGRDCFWGAYLMEQPALLGTVGTHLHRGEEIEIGYWFAVQARGRGLAVEAVAGVVSALASGYPGHRIVAECRPQNGASWRLLERVGFRDGGEDGERPGRRRLAFEPRSAS